jgi:DNA-binding MarR family transcriptional regulator
MPLSEKEFAVIREISNNHKPTQRHIAKNTGISLGLTNLIIKRLIKKGYIKIHEAPARTIMYSLTPQGFAEKARKSYHFILGTVRVMGDIREGIQEIIMNEYRKGARDFTIQGNGELANLTEIVFRSLDAKDIRLSQRELETNKIICNLLVNIGGSRRKINLLSELSKKGLYR